MRNDNENKARRILYEDNLFREALKKAAMLEGEKFIKENQDLDIGEIGLSAQKQGEFQYRLDKALQEKKSRTRFFYTKPIQKVAVIILIISAVVSISLLSVDAFRVKIFNFFIETKPEYTEFRLDQKNQNTESGKVVGWPNAYIPTYIPEGYLVESSENGKIAKTITLENDDGKIIDYAQYSEDTGFNYDTEDAVLWDIAVNDEAGTLITKADHYSIIWKHGNSIFVVMTQISEEETLKIAENIKFFK